MSARSSSLTVRLHFSQQVIRFTETGIAGNSFGRAKWIRDRHGQRRNCLCTGAKSPSKNPACCEMRIGERVVQSRHDGATYVVPAEHQPQFVRRMGAYSVSDSVA